MAKSEKMKVDEVVGYLNTALAAQTRSMLLYLAASASLPALELRAGADWFLEAAKDEMDDARVLIEKIVALGGTPTTDASPAPWPGGVREAIPELIRAEEESLKALKDSIEPTGQEPRSEAAEHLVEHLIMRKQRRIDLLKRADGS